MTDAALTDDATELRTGLDQLGFSQSRFAGLLTALGDRREIKTVLRSIQRMATGDARLSGEMQVILTLLKREEARARRVAASTVWTVHDDGRQSTVIQGVRVSVSPQSRGRWSIFARHIADGPDGFSPEFPHWRDNLEDAKLRAVLAVDETLDKLDWLAAQAAEDEARSSDTGE